MDYRSIPIRLRDRETTASEAAGLIRDGQTLAVSGYTSAGFPKAVPAELARRQRAGETLGLHLISGSLVGQIDEQLSDLTVRRTPMFESRRMRKAVNERRIAYVEQQIAKMPRLLLSGTLGPVHVAVVEALGFTEEGHLIPSSSVGLVPHLVRLAESVIVEINEAQPEGLLGLHDVFLPGTAPDRRRIPMRHPGHRFGEPFVRIGRDKIKAIVRTAAPDTLDGPGEPTGAMVRIAANLMDFLETEAAKSWPKGLPPIQSGVGSLSHALVGAFRQSRFRDLTFFCGMLNEAAVEMLATGQAVAASASAVQMTPRVASIIRDKGAQLKRGLVLRNQDITNDIEVTARMGILALNSGLEADIYGNVNASHVHGTHVVNGLGGVANFAQASSLSVMLLPSCGKEGRVSGIVPMVPHVDVSEHDVDILVTDQGVADLRGKDDVERAECIISRCAHPAFREPLAHYLRKAVARVGGHHPQIPAEAYAWHQRLEDTGSMDVPGRLGR